MLVTGVIDEPECELDVDGECTVPVDEPTVVLED